MSLAYLKLLNNEAISDRNLCIDQKFLNKVNGPMLIQVNQYDLTPIYKYVISLFFMKSLAWGHKFSQRSL